MISVTLQNVGFGNFEELCAQIGCCASCDRISINSDAEFLSRLDAEKSRKRLEEKGCRANANCVTAVAKASDDLSPHVGEGVDDAPGIELSFVGHESFLLVVVGCVAMEQ